MLFLNTILDLLFPDYCLVCGKIGQVLCQECLAQSPEAERESAEWIFPLFDYRHPPVKKAIWFLKYKNKRRLARIFAEAMYPRILEELADQKTLNNFSSPILIPIPLAPKRQRERGFNQSLLICDKLAKMNKNSDFILGKNILVKPRDTEHQARIENRTIRLKNISGSFAVKDPEKIKNRNIILVDDVTTTGATLSEAKKVLKHSGAKKIIAFTVAH